VPTLTRDVSLGGGDLRVQVAHARRVAEARVGGGARGGGSGDPARFFRISVNLGVHLSRVERAFLLANHPLEFVQPASVMRASRSVRVGIDAAVWAWAWVSGGLGNYTNEGDEK
jgi:hypothetical protein